MCKSCTEKFCFSFLHSANISCSIWLCKTSIRKKKTVNDKSWHVPLLPANHWQEFSARIKEMWCETQSPSQQPLGERRVPAPWSLQIHTSFAVIKMLCHCCQVFLKWQVLATLMTQCDSMYILCIHALIFPQIFISKLLTVFVVSWNHARSALFTQWNVANLWKSPFHIEQIKPLWRRNTNILIRGR